MSSDLDATGIFPKHCALWTEKKLKKIPRTPQFIFEVIFGFLVSKCIYMWNPVMQKNACFKICTQSIMVEAPVLRVKYTENFFIIAGTIFLIPGCERASSFGFFVYNNLKLDDYRV